jgi:hypothetical protein
MLRDDEFKDDHEDLDENFCPPPDEGTCDSEEDNMDLSHKRPISLGKSTTT